MINRRNLFFLLTYLLTYLSINRLVYSVRDLCCFKLPLHLGPYDAIPHVTMRVYKIVTKAHDWPVICVLVLY